MTYLTHSRCTDPPWISRLSVAVAIVLCVLLTYVMGLSFGWPAP